MGKHDNGGYTPTSDNLTTPPTPNKGRGLPIYRHIPPPPPPSKKIRPEFQTMYELLVDAEKYEAKGSIVITHRLLGILKESIDDFINAADAN